MADDPNQDDPKIDPVPDPPDPEDSFDKDRAMNTIKAQREEAKQLRADLKALKEKADRLDQIEAEKLSEQEKLAKRAEEAEARIAQAEAKLRQANLLVELSKPDHGIVSAAAAAKLIEGVEYDEDGRPSNLATILPEFLETNTFLKGAPGKPKPPATNAGDGSGNTPPPALTADELEWAQRTGMNPEAYAAYKKGGPTTLEDFQRIREKQTAA